MKVGEKDTYAGAYGVPYTPLEIYGIVAASQAAEPMVALVRILRTRIRELEKENVRLNSANKSLRKGGIPEEDIQFPRLTFPAAQKVIQKLLRKQEARKKAEEEKLQAAKTGASLSQTPKVLNDSVDSFTSTAREHTGDTAYLSASTYMSISDNSTRNGASASVLESIRDSPVIQTAGDKLLKRPTEESLTPVSHPAKKRKLAIVNPIVKSPFKGSNLLQKVERAKQIALGFADSIEDLLDTEANVQFSNTM